MFGDFDCRDLSVEDVDIGYLAKTIRIETTGVRHLQASLARTDCARRDREEVGDQRS